MLVPESLPGLGNEAVFRVERSRPSNAHENVIFAETVIVEWAVSNDGRADLEPDNGTLIFPEVKYTVANVCS